MTQKSDPLSELRKQVSTHGAILWIGPDTSLEEHFTSLSHKDIAQELAAHCDVPAAWQDSLQIVAEIYEAKFGRQALEARVKQLQNGLALEKNDLLHLILSIPFQAIITFAYDRALENAIQAAKESFKLINISKLEELSRAKTRHQTPIICICDTTQDTTPIADSRILLTHRDFSGLYSYKIELFKKYFTSSAWLFIGWNPGYFTLFDEFTRILHDIPLYFGKHVAWQAANPEIIQLRKLSGIHVYKLSAKDFLEMVYPDVKGYIEMLDWGLIGYKKYQKALDIDMFGKLNSHKEQYRATLNPDYCELMLYSAIILDNDTAFWWRHSLKILNEDTIKKVVISAGDKSIPFIQQVIPEVNNNLCESLVETLLMIQTPTMERYIRRTEQIQREAPFTLNYASWNDTQIPLHDRKQSGDIQILDESLAWLYETINQLMKRNDYEAQVMFVAERALDRQDTPFYSRMIVARLLGTLGRPVSIQYLVAMLQSEDNLWVKQAIVEALIEIGESAGEYIVGYILKFGNGNIEILLRSLCSIAISPRTNTGFRLVCYCLARELLFFSNSEILPRISSPIARILSVYGLSHNDKLSFDTIDMDRMLREKFIWILEADPNSFDQYHIIGGDNSHNTFDLIITRLIEHFCLTDLSILTGINDLLTTSYLSMESLYVFFQGIAQLHRSQFGYLNQETISNLLGTILANESHRAMINIELIDKHGYDRFVELVLRLYPLNITSLVNQDSNAQTEWLQSAIKLWESIRPQERRDEATKHEIIFKLDPSPKESLPKITFRRLS